jgi:sugar phosphate isomerase/epimerase
MNVSVLLTSFPGDFADAVRQAAQLGFAHVDVVARTARPPQDLDVLADTGLFVACASLGRGLPESNSLDSSSDELRREALAVVEDQMADAARLGARHAYLVPPADMGATGLARFAGSCRRLADFAAGRRVRLCLEPIPGRALPCVTSALDWLTSIGHPNLRLLLDIGHCTLSREDPVAAVAKAGALLDFVHCNDNDGTSDLHWPLLTGRITRDELKTLIAALHKNGYNGFLTLELNPQTPEVSEALRSNRLLLDELVRSTSAAGKDDQ